ncbi:MAG: glycosyltransferase [Lactobacillales bacterium]|jgi:glycosyltransferase involved in cell wall biosynthesis|nr:glycosyltransferase [Lactobacillales bacterium]
MNKRKLYILFFIFIAGIFIGCFSFAAFQKFFPPKISVVMSTYNRADLIGRAIESILNQTYQNFEFIIIDDASTDNTVQIIKSHMQTDKRIKLVENRKNRGLAENLNTGIQMATGKYIARIDDDDYSLPRRFERQVALLQANPDLAAVGTASSKIGVYDVYSFTDITDPEIIKSLFYLSCNPILHTSVMMRRSFLNAHGLAYNPRNTYAEDYGLWLDILAAGGKFSNVPEILHFYREHTTNSKSYYRTQRQTARRLYDRLLVLFSPDDSFYAMTTPEKLRRLVEINDVQKIMPPEKFARAADLLLELEQVKESARQKGNK